ncbi:putative F-box/kelch-repeat protein At3g20710 [Lolium perenne]|uniref:putative F-box/kelch-repeat protein At3g20710 n=1 Tax=Lolium perenne TaxID=4522 RepID=UPI0021F6079E|nr:putative F-box/kelch-repeat protein At3g20710 [Lolium perenne]
MDIIPTDLVVEILQRLPWTSRRRMRLVCRSWRDLVHKRTTEMKQRRDAVPLIVTTKSVYVLGDLGSSKSRPTRELWRSTDVYKHMEVVGVCNGVLCLCDDTKPGGAITLANPATGDFLALPPIPRAGLFRRHNSRRSGRSWHQAYSFGYHHGTGQYKVVHVPCFFKTKETLQVFTLGEASWREVPAPGDRCRLDAGVVSVNGATYWVVEGSERIVSFDHRSEQVKTVTPLPVSDGPIGHLTEVQRRLSVAIVTRVDPKSVYYCGRGDGTIEVWILENKSKEQTWVHQYSLRSLSCLPGPSSIQMVRPIFIHGDYILMVQGQSQRLRPYRRRPNSYVTRQECSAVHINSCDPQAFISNMKGDICRVFAYVESADALGVYRRW